MTYLNALKKNRRQLDWLVLVTMSRFVSIIDEGYDEKEKF